MSEYETKQTYTVRLRERGQITIPQAIRDKWAANANDPDVLNLIEIGDALFLSPKRLLLPELSKQFSSLMDEAGVSLADLLEGLAKERQSIYEEKYGSSS